MKRFILLTCLISAMIISQAQPEKKLQTKPDEITVFTSAAEIHRETQFTLAKGMQILVFDSLSPQINANSIQVKGKGNFTILDTRYRLKQHNPLEKETAIPPKIQTAINALEDSIRIMSYKLRPYTNQMEVLTMEKNLLLNNQLVRGNGGDTIPELKQTMLFFRDKMNEINSQILKIEQEKYPVETKLTAMNNRLTRLKSYSLQQNNRNYPAVPQILVQISGESSGPAQIELSYLVNNAGWNASYDIRANDDEDITLIYKANVYQNSGKSWENIKLTLSTANPNQQHYKPALQIWYLSYNQYQQQYTRTSSTLAQEKAPTSSNREVLLDDMEVAGYANQYTENTASSLNLSYSINLDYTIPSDGNYHSVPIQQKNLGSEFKYYAAPAINKDAFLMAEITDWKDMELLSGQANIYYNGRYNGQTNLYPDIIRDSMEIALGSSQRLLIDREKLSDNITPSLVGNYETKTIEYEITIKNTRNQEIHLVLEDRIPLSNTKDIEVKLLKSDGAEFNEKNAHLTWDLTIPANQTKTIKYSFSVKYDSKQNLNI
ncbi:MAG: DUF4139 domain-containing protein [Bacteroidales bacterium]|jgi:uncharacterized protein (TIGR02231 family)|nr:DUF4139 domain-containing protein [Bacteroidales bacterium]